MATSDPPPKAPQNQRRAPGWLPLLALPVLGLFAAVILIAAQDDVASTNDNSADVFASPPPVTFVPPSPDPPGETDVPAEGSVIGGKAPAFTLTTLDGASLQLDALDGRIVFLNFWASWCEPCTREMPALQALQDAFPPDRVLVIGVTDPEAGQTEQAIRDFLDENEITFTIALTSDLVFYQRFNVLQIPVTYIIDRQGVVRFRHLGELEPDDVQSYLNQLVE